jgi:sugar lactone lactonase YvrE
VRALSIAGLFGQGINGMGRDFRLSLADVSFVGHDLHRPECVIAAASGELFVSDWRGGITVIRRDGAQQLIVPEGPVDGVSLKPNGICRRAAGSFLLAHLDEAEGGVFELWPDGRARPFLREVEGVTLPPTNYVLEDDRGRVWITVSTRMVPRHGARARDHADGFIALVDEEGARIVADGLGFTNEVRPGLDGRHLYVNETFARRLTRFRIAADGSLHERTTVTDFGHGTFPDGVAIDREGALWITSVISNRVIRVRPDGAQDLVLEDMDPAFVERFEQDYLSGALCRQGPLPPVPHRKLANISSLDFGPDGATAYLGCLQGEHIATFRVPWLG